MTGLGPLASVILSLNFLFEMIAIVCVINNDNKNMNFFLLNNKDMEKDDFIYIQKMVGKYTIANNLINYCNVKYDSGDIEYKIDNDLVDLFNHGGYRLVFYQEGPEFLTVFLYFEIHVLDLSIDYDSVNYDSVKYQFLYNVKDIIYIQSTNETMEAIEEEFLKAGYTRYSSYT